MARIDYHLSAEDLAALKVFHAGLKDRRQAYRVNVVILLGQGWPIGAVAEALLLDENTCRTYFRRYKDGGTDRLMEMDSGGSEALLTHEQLSELSAHLDVNLYQTAQEVAHHVNARYGVYYTVRGITALLQRLGFVYKKAKLVPGKADTEKQKAFIAEHNERKKNMGLDEVIYFADATHPQHNPVATHGWIRRGQDWEIPSNTGRARLNINGAIGLHDFQPIVRFDRTINADSAIALCKQLEQANPKAKRIYVIVDNARYYRAKMVREYLENSPVDFVFLPPYSPNLNLIERYWKFVKKKLLYNTYYEDFNSFEQAFSEFFTNWREHVQDLESLLTENFSIIQAPLR